MLKLKVCGMRDPDNIDGLVALAPDFIGFIFFAKSPRDASGLARDVTQRIPRTIHKVGVFVNESTAHILNIAKHHALDYVQLHGDESVADAAALRDGGLRVIKVWRVSDALPTDLADYRAVMDYALFDTASTHYGGSGKQFDWSILHDYPIDTPLLLSGGIGIEDIDRIHQLKLDPLAGIDVNSRFEHRPAFKDLIQLNQLKALL